MISLLLFLRLFRSLILFAFLLFILSIQWFLHYNFPFPVPQKPPLFSASFSRTPTTVFTYIFIHLFFLELLLLIFPPNIHKFGRGRKCEKIRFSLMEFDYRELVKATQSFSHSSLLGKGSHGCVYKAVLHDDHHRLPNVIAIKRASFNGGEVFLENSKKLNNEIQVLSSLSDHENPNVVNYLGTSSDCENQNKLLVMEFLPNASLYNLLHNSSSSASPPPSWPKRVEIAIQIAKAIHFLHEVANPVIIHRDIKSSNILFDANWIPKLVDFGLAVDASSITSQPVQPAGTIGYLDPSYTSPNKLSTKTDMFSFGVVLLEIISCRKAIDVSKQPASIVEWATALIKEKRAMEICDTSVSLPSYMEGTIKHMLNLAARCVSLEEDNRPEIGEVFMVETCFVERVRTIPIWMSLWGSVMRMKRRQRRSDFPSKKQLCDRDNDNGDNICRGKMILREILADISLK